MSALLPFRSSSLSFSFLLLLDVFPGFAPKDNVTPIRLGASRFVTVLPPPRLPRTHSTVRARRITFEKQAAKGVGPRSAIPPQATGCSTCALLDLTDRRLATRHV